ncbi:MAG: hypothetical protein ACKO7R_15425, partial [Pseudanabaena sp.]
HFDNLVKEVKESGEPYYSFKVTAFPHYQNLAKKDNIFKKGLMLYVGLFTNRIIGGEPNLQKWKNRVRAIFKRIMAIGI